MYDKTVLKIFTDVGINDDKDTIVLLIDAIIFNAFIVNGVLNDNGLNMLIEELGKRYNTDNSNVFFPVSAIFKLKYDTEGMPYVHITNIVVLWSCMLTILPKKLLTEQNFVNFVKLTLSRSLDSEYLDPCNQLFSEFVTYYYKVGKNGNLPEKVVNHLNAIKQGKICAQLSALSEFPKFTSMLKEYVDLLQYLIRETFVDGEASNPAYWLKPLKTPYDFISDFTYQPKVYRIFADNGIAVKEGDVIALFHAAMLGATIDHVDFLRRNTPQTIASLIHDMYRFRYYKSFGFYYYESMLSLVKQMKAGGKIIPLAYYAFSIMGWDVQKFRDFAEYVSGISSQSYEKIR
ncbi:hypothetical protein [Ehrlichia canis]|uniref:Uncharacterized protein n=1 Tax=Ehrlichia canis (strain Jake) TaxID=269484 RepID=A0ACA6AWY9_EHRCJ|nr:hypothetical protein [Ehrlichia canis]AAZ68868.1 hypothetical protein Ecaj_0837 [Ehrlichia canis str. Jake]AUO55076.1 hypothetical protein C1I72_04410 [Ehrlichia canis]UKC53274.1 hypothetical protein s20019040002_000317 [Ehrlichia canis]UKC54211.1 hypothetical protein s20026770001_000317 [Ehrlichia canis]UKC55147.1 hypothetical protein s21009500007_000317 [Ehrlichia canis]